MKRQLMKRQQQVLPPLVRLPQLTQQQAQYQPVGLSPQTRRQQPELKGPEPAPLRQISKGQIPRPGRQVVFSYLCFFYGRR